GGGGGWDGKGRRAMQGAAGGGLGAGRPPAGRPDRQDCVATKGGASAGAPPRRAAPRACQSKITARRFVGRDTQAVQRRTWRGGHAQPRAPVSSRKRCKA